MDVLKMIKDVSAMKSKLNEVEKSLKDLTVEVENSGVSLKLNAKQEPLALKIPDEFLQKDLADIEKILLKLFQKGIQESQKLMNKEALKLTGGLKIPGLS